MKAVFWDKNISNRFTVFAARYSDTFDTHYEVSVYDNDILDDIAKQEYPDAETMFQVFDNITEDNIQQFIQEHQFTW